MARGAGARMCDFGSYGTQQGTFYLPKSALEPRLELIAKIFPQVDEWLNNLNFGEAADNVAAHWFLKLLKTMKITFLQDAAIMIDDFPNHRVFSNALFQDPLFLEFKRYILIYSLFIMFANLSFSFNI
jgi:hypothetical protein